MADSTVSIGAPQDTRAAAEAAQASQSSGPAELKGPVALESGAHGAASLQNRGVQRRKGARRQGPGWRGTPALPFYPVANGPGFAPNGCYVGDVAAVHNYYRGAGYAMYGPAPGYGYPLPQFPQHNVHPYYHRQFMPPQQPEGMLAPQEQAAENGTGIANRDSAGSGTSDALNVVNGGVDSVNNSHLSQATGANNAEVTTNPVKGRRNGSKSSGGARSSGLGRNNGDKSNTSGRSARSNGPASREQRSESSRAGRERGGNGETAAAAAASTTKSNRAGGDVSREARDARGPKNRDEKSAKRFDANILDNLDEFPSPAASLGRKESPDAGEDASPEVAAGAAGAVKTKALTKKSSWADIVRPAAETPADSHAVSSATSEGAPHAELLAGGDGEGVGDSQTALEEEHAAKIASVIAAVVGTGNTTEEDEAEAASAALAVATAAVADDWPSDNGKEAWPTGSGSGSSSSSSHGAAGFDPLGYSQAGAASASSEAFANAGAWSGGGGVAASQEERLPLPQGREEGEQDGARLLQDVERQGPLEEEQHPPGQQYLASCQQAAFTVPPYDINPASFNTEVQDARFFVVKSCNEACVLQTFYTRTWVVTEHGAKRIETAQVAVGSDGAPTPPVYLIAMVHGANRLCGIAEMTGPVSFGQGLELPRFPLKWIYLKDVLGRQLRHISIKAGDHRRSILSVQDAQEIPLHEGREVLRAFAAAGATSSLLYAPLVAPQRLLPMQQHMQLPYGWAPHYGAAPYQQVYYQPPWYPSPQQAQAYPPYYGYGQPQVGNFGNFAAANGQGCGPPLVSAPNGTFENVNGDLRVEAATHTLSHPDSSAVVNGVGAGAAVAVDESAANGSSSGGKGKKSGGKKKKSGGRGGGGGGSQQTAAASQPPAQAQAAGKATSKQARAGGGGNSSKKSAAAAAAAALEAAAATGEPKGDGEAEPARSDAKAADKKAGRKDTKAAQPVVKEQARRSGDASKPQAPATAAAAPKKGPKGQPRLGNGNGEDKAPVAGEGMGSAATSTKQPAAAEPVKEASERAVSEAVECAGE